MKRAIALSIFFIICDQVTKYLALITLQSEYFLLGSWLSFHLQFNKGIAFSIHYFNDYIVLLIGFLIVTGTYLAYRYLDFKKTSYALSFSCIFAGACGNFLDRLMYGHVIDFIKVGWWPVFNIADSLISLGVIICIAEELTGRSKK